MSNNAPPYQILARRTEELQRLNELILSSAGEGIYGLDCSGLTTFVNPPTSRQDAGAPSTALAR